MTNPLRPPLTTADVIRETRLRNAAMSPESRRAAARAAAMAMTPAERRELARRNASRVLEASGKVAEAGRLTGQRGQPGVQPGPPGQPMTEAEMDAAGVPFTAGQGHRG